MLLRSLSAGVLAAALFTTPAIAAELSGAVGATGQGGATLRLGASQPWQARWFDSSTGHLSGYWDAAYTYWEGGKEASGAHSLSFAPVFVYEFHGERFQPFIEFGIGVSAFSSSRVGDQVLGSSFNFEDRLGVGVRFGEHHRVGLRAIHYSNAGLKNPNDGIESYSLYYTRTF